MENKKLISFQIWYKVVEDMMYNDLKLKAPDDDDDYVYNIS